MKNVNNVNNVNNYENPIMLPLEGFSRTEYYFMKSFLTLVIGFLFCFSLNAKTIDKLKDVPPAIVKFCHDPSGRIADAGQPWEISDAGDGRLPRSLLIGACRHSNSDWSILCQKGGYASSYHLVKVKKVKSVWKKISEDQSPNPTELKCP